MAKVNVLNFMSNIEQRSWVHHLDPRTKVFLILFFSFMPFIFSDPLILLIFIALTLPLWLSSNIDFRPMLGAFGGLTFFLIIIFLLNALRLPNELVNPDPQFAYTWYIRLGPIVATSRTIYRAEFLTLRLICPMTIGLLVIATTDPTFLAKGLRMLRIPTSVVFMLLAGLRFIPIVMEQMFIVLDAQQIRGVKGSRIQRTKLMLLPLFITSLRRSRIMGLACEAKGFGAGRWNSFYENFHYGVADKAIIIILIILTIGSLIARFGFGIGIPFIQGH
jgi:energy-coupling factor transport system permease protein